MAEPLKPVSSSKSAVSTICSHLGTIVVKAPLALTTSEWEDQRGDFVRLREGIHD